LGKPRTIDDANGNIIRLIDGKPAVSFYEDYFKEILGPLGTNSLGQIGLLYPLGINTSPGTPYVLRHPVQILNDGSLVCQSEVPRGSNAHLMIGKKDALRQAVIDAASDIRDQLLNKPPKILLVFSSIARYKVLGRGVSQDLHLIKEILGLTTPVFGMYTYGEIAPLGALKNAEKVQLQNASITIAAIA
jgi:hypothetical protein